MVKLVQFCAILVSSFHCRVSTKPCGGSWILSKIAHDNSAAAPMTFISGVLVSIGELILKCMGRWRNCQVNR